MIHSFTIKKRQDIRQKSIQTAHLFASRQNLSKKVISKNQQSLLYRKDTLRDFF